MTLRALDDKLRAVRDEHGVTRRYELDGAMAEAAALRRSWAVVDLSSRRLVRLSGPDRRQLLQAVVSQDVSRLRPGQGCRAALLNPKGHILALLRALEGEDETLLELHRSSTDTVLGRLNHYRVAAKVSFAPLDDVLLAVLGPEAEHALEGASAARLPDGAESHGIARLGPASVRVVRAGDMPGGLVLSCSHDSAAALFEMLVERGARPVGAEALDALRVEAGVPWQDPDVISGNLLHEIGLAAELHAPRKGCYVGQEVVARLESRGAHVSRRLCRLTLSRVVASGTPLTRDSESVGVLTTCAVSPALGPCALGYVHRKHLAPGNVLQAGDTDASVLGLSTEPLADDGSQERSPR